MVKKQHTNRAYTIILDKRIISQPEESQYLDEIRGSSQQNGANSLSPYTIVLLKEVFVFTRTPQITIVFTYSW